MMITSCDIIGLLGGEEPDRPSNVPQNNHNGGGGINIWGDNERPNDDTDLDIKPPYDTSDPFDTGKPTDTNPPEETNGGGVVVLPDNPPDNILDYRGKAVNILIRSPQQYRREWRAADDQTELDYLDQEIVRRNQKVETMLNVKLNYKLNTAADENMNDLITVAGKNGMGEYDIVSNYAALATSTNVLQYYMNFNNEQFTYMDLTKPYWNQSFIKDAEAFGKLYVCVGDANLSVYDRAIVVFYNKAKAEIYLNDVNLYQMVIDKEWTYEEFYNIIANLYEDNGTQDEADDFYGVASIKGSEAMDGFLYSLGASLTQKDANGNHTLVTDSAYTRLGSAFTMVYDFWQTEGSKMIEGSGNNYDFFTTGKALFDIDVMYHYESGNQMLRNMTDGYGVIPMPMFNTDQGEYMCGIQDAHNVMSIVSHFNQDYEMISAVMESLHAESYSSVRPFYIEKIVKGQFLDADSNTVFEMILNGTRWDFADIYNAAIGNTHEKIWRGPLRKQSIDTVDAGYAANAETFNQNLATIDQWMALH